MSESVSAKIQNNIRMAIEVFDAHGNEIREMIRFHIKNDSEVDDVFQEFFLSIIRRPIPQNIQDVKGYLYRAITNDIIDLSRRQKNYQERIKKYSEILRYNFIQEDLQKIIMQKDSVQKLFKLIENRLSNREAEAVFKTFNSNFDVRNTAGRMYVDKRTISRYLCLALKKIRLFVNEEKEDYL